MFNPLQPMFNIFLIPPPLTHSVMMFPALPGGDPQGRLGRGGVKRVQAGVLAFLAAFSLVAWASDQMIIILL